VHHLDTGRLEGSKSGAHTGELPVTQQLRLARRADVHGLQTREHVSVREDRTETSPARGIARVMRAVVVDDLDFGQAGEPGKTLECNPPEHCFRQVIHGSYGQ
jgi:hypothetical protein